MVLSRITNGGSPRLLVLGAFESIGMRVPSHSRDPAKPESPPFLFKKAESSAGEQRRRHLLRDVRHQCASGAAAPGSGFLSRRVSGIIATSTAPTSQNASR